MLVHRRVTPSIKFAGTHLYTWVERGTVRVECLAQEHNTMSPTRARTQTARSGVKLSNHEVTTPSILHCTKGSGYKSSDVYLRHLRSSVDHFSQSTCHQHFNWHLINTLSTVNEQYAECRPTHKHQSKLSRLLTVMLIECRLNVN